MKSVKITAIRKVEHKDLSAIYENPIEHTCDVSEGTIYISHNAQRPKEMCESAWQSMESLDRKSVV